MNVWRIWEISVTCKLSSIILINLIPNNDIMHQSNTIIVEVIIL